RLRGYIIACEVAPEEVGSDHERLKIDEERGVEEHVRAEVSRLHHVGGDIYEIRLVGVRHVGQRTAHAIHAQAKRKEEYNRNYPGVRGVQAAHLINYEVRIMNYE